MVRLVFRPYTQIRRSICTLESLRASTRVSPGFTLHRHSSPSFGSQQICSHSNLSSTNHDRSMVRVGARHTLPPQTLARPLLSLRTAGFSHPSTRIYVRLLGPCFKTGRTEPFRQHRDSALSPQSTAAWHRGRFQAGGTHPKRGLGTSLPWLYTAYSTDADTGPSPGTGAPTTGSVRFPFSNFKSFALSFQSSFHLSLAVLVRYRSLADI